VTGFDSYPIPGFTQPVSSLTHLLGAAVFAVLAVPLLRRARGHGGRVAALGVFAFACVFLLAISGVYHLLALGSAGRAVVERLDHGAIFVLIAGSFTPVHGILFRGLGRWGPLLLVWAAAVTGITLKTIFFTGFPEWLGLTLYLGLGWLGAATMLVLWRRYGPGFVRPLVWGGLAYTAGAVLEFLRWPVLVPGVVGPHDLFHLAVLAGIGCHWRFMARLAAAPLPLPRPRFAGAPAFVVQ
jgi:channel protein (hemolysin III family)